MIDDLDGLDVKRPGTGFSPDQIDKLIGKTLIREVAEDTLITKQDFS